MHKDKILEMIRSILPSKARKAARSEKTRIHRANRHQVRQAIRDVAGNIDFDDDIPDDDELVLRIHRSDKLRKRNTQMMVVERRAADKINHFVRWCEKRTAHIPKDKIEARYFNVSGLVGGPKDLIREHALGHFLDPEYDFNPYFGTWRQVRRLKNATSIEVTAFRTAIKAVFESHEHKLLNRLCKSHTYRRCTEDDPCTSRETYKVWLYRFLTQHRWAFYHKESTRKPLDYKPGTLSYMKVTKVREIHDESRCENRILLAKADDVDVLVDYLFGQSPPRESNHFITQHWYGHKDALIYRLCNFLEEHGFMDFDLPERDPFRIARR